MACTSVLVTRNSTPLIPAWIIRLTAFPPPPPTPITLIFAVSCSSSSEIFSLPAFGDSSNVIIYRLPLAYQFNLPQTSFAATRQPSPTPGADAAGCARDRGNPTAAARRPPPIPVHSRCRRVPPGRAERPSPPADRTPARSSPPYRPSPPRHPPPQRRRGSLSPSRLFPDQARQASRSRPRAVRECSSARASTESS